jgi:ATP-dependent DNA ligase
LNGKSLLKEPFLLRRSLLHHSFNHLEGFFHFASGCDHLENGDTTAIEIFMQEACHSACEGLMVKTLAVNASYEPSKRSLNWLKLKKDYINGMGVCDSVDLVVIGGYYGRGKRTNVYGAYLMAVSDVLSVYVVGCCDVVFSILSLFVTCSAMIQLMMNIKVFVKLGLASKTKTSLVSRSR